MLLNRISSELCTLRNKVQELTMRKSDLLLVACGHNDCGCLWVCSDLVCVWEVREVVDCPGKEARRVNTGTAGLCEVQAVDKGSTK